MSTSLNTGSRLGRHARHQRTDQRSTNIFLRLVGAGLLWATAGMHLDLYLTGYRTIPTIGWLFLFQVLAGLLLGLLVLGTGLRLAAAVGAGFALSTLGGYLLSVQFGLFGFREVRTTAGIVAGIIEVAAFAVLAAYALTGAENGRVPILKMRDLGMSQRQAGLSTGVVCVLALGLFIGVLAGASAAPAASATTAGSVLRTTTIGGKTVLTNSKGLTLYWFALDTPNKSMCSGSCAQYWPPVHGPDSAGAGVTGRLGTIRRTDGSLQETYDGHPLYTYIGDSAPGQAHGNNVDLNGGYWHEVVVVGG
jgi:predicted lipoprotein with Yx(FWY)xxD motif